jgi:hypothetical protein
VLILDGRNGQEPCVAMLCGRRSTWSIGNAIPRLCLCSGPRLFEETRRAAPETITYPVNIN